MTLPKPLGDVSARGGAAGNVGARLVKCSPISDRRAEYRWRTAEALVDTTVGLERAIPDAKLAVAELRSARLGRQVRP